MNPNNNMNLNNNVNNNDNLLSLELLAETFTIPPFKTTTTTEVRANSIPPFTTTTTTATEKVHVNSATTNNPKKMNSNKWLAFWDK